MYGKLVLYCVFVLASAQLNDIVDKCECSPICESRGLKCNGRLMPRSDCPCCMMCYSGYGQKCDASTPCEPSLTCSNSGECEGCSTENGNFTVGQQFYRNECSEICTCSDTGEASCVATQCPYGLFQAGSSKDKGYCIELRSLPMTDACCVVLACKEEEKLSKRNSLKERKTGKSLFTGMDDSELKETLNDLQNALESQRIESKVLSPAVSDSTAIKPSLSLTPKGISTSLDQDVLTNVESPNLAEYLGQPAPTLAQNINIGVDDIVSNTGIVTTSSKNADISSERPEIVSASSLSAKPETTPMTSTNKNEASQTSISLDVLSSSEPRSITTPSGESSSTMQKEIYLAKNDQESSTLTTISNFKSSTTDVLSSLKPQSISAPSAESNTTMQTEINLAINDQKSSTVTTTSSLKSSSKKLTDMSFSEPLSITTPSGESSSTMQTEIPIPMNNQESSTTTTMPTLNSSIEMNSTTTYLPGQIATLSSLSSTVTHKEEIINESLSSHDISSTTEVNNITSDSTPETALSITSPANQMVRLRERDNVSSDENMTTTLHQDHSFVPIQNEQNIVATPLKSHTTTTMTTDKTSPKKPSNEQKQISTTSLEHISNQQDFTTIKTITEKVTSDNTTAEGSVIKKDSRQINLLGADRADDANLLEDKSNKDQKEAVTFNAFDNEEDLGFQNVKLGKISFSKSNHNSTIVILPSPSGGVLNYKESKTGSNTLRRTVQNGQSEILISGLTPSTSYTFKWAGFDSSISKMEFTTSDGCSYKASTYPIGATFNDGCEKTCTCEVGGHSLCTDRCIFAKGSLKDEHCIEKPSLSDPECCVEYACQNKETPLLSDGAKSTLQDAQAKLIVTSRSSNSFTVAWDDFRTISQDEEYVAQYRMAPSGGHEAESWFTQESPQETHLPTMTISDLKPNTLYQVRVGIMRKSLGDNLLATTETITVRTESNNPCDSKSCEEHAECSVESGVAMCKCMDGYVKNPSDKCTKGEMLDMEKKMCNFQQKTYSPGEIFFDGCQHKCTCDIQGEIDCKPRCEFSEKDFQKNPECESYTDPDDSCCKLMLCNSTLKSKVSKVQSFDGCQYRNNTYKNNEIFTIGCELKCLCMGYGDVSCEPRCPPEANDNSEMSEVCHTVPDPDDNCCTVTVCGKDNDEVVKVPEEESEIPFYDDVEMAGADAPNATANATAKGANATAANATTVKGANLTTSNANTTVASNTTINPNATTGSTVQGRTLNNNVTSTTPSTNTTIDRKLQIQTTTKPVVHIEIIDIRPVDAETVQLTIKVSKDIMAQLLSFAKDELTVSFSTDAISWKNKTIPIGAIKIISVNSISLKVNGVKSDQPHQFRITYKGVSSAIKKSLMPDYKFNSFAKGTTPKPGSNAMCIYKGKVHKGGENFYDGCKLFCTCTDKGLPHCAPIQCPMNFGLDIMDPGCLEWRNDETYVPTPPRCCQRKPRCILRIEDLACKVKNHTFNHLDVLPSQFVKCDQRCQCRKGHVHCENICSPVTAIPPSNLPCLPSQARIVKNPGYPCCSKWQCATSIAPNVYPPIIHGKPFHPVTTQPSRSIVPIILDIKANSVEFTFSIPKTFVGLPGGIYLRYTNNPALLATPLKWQSEIIHEDGVTLSDAQWTYRKMALTPGTNYSMQISLTSHLTKSEITSSVFFVSTIPTVTTPLPRLELNAGLTVSNIKNTSARISWRKFTEYELQFIDGIGVRYWPKGKKFPLEGPMLHRTADSFILKDLIPNTSYTVDLVFMPPHTVSTNIFNTHNRTFTTLPKPKDKYAFNITIAMGDITDKGVKILYFGVNDPEGKYVNVYRVVYTTDGDLNNSHKFKVPKNQKEGYILLTDLKPGVAYEVWLEAYLTNGSKKKSNVITIHTKPSSGRHKTSAGFASGKEDSYYSEMVGVAIFAAFLCIALALLVLYMVKKQNKSKAQISTKAAYDNPSYKEGEAGYAMEMNGMKSNGNSRDIT